MSEQARVLFTLDPNEMPAPEPVDESKSVEPTIKIVKIATSPGDRELLITIEGPTIEDVSGAEARSMAFKARHQYGFSNGGFDAMNIGGVYPHEDRFRYEYRIIRTNL